MGSESIVDYIKSSLGKPWPSIANGSPKANEQTTSQSDGLYPEWDEFYLLVCDICGIIIRPQALEKHLATKHQVSVQNNQQSQPTQQQQLQPNPDKHLNQPKKQPPQLIATSPIPQANKTTNGKISQPSNNHNHTNGSSDNQLIKQTKQVTKQQQNQSQQQKLNPHPRHTNNNDASQYSDINNIRSRGNNIIITNNSNGNSFNNNIFSNNNGLNGAKTIIGTITNNFTKRENNSITTTTTTKTASNILPTLVTTKATTTTTNNNTKNIVIHFNDKHNINHHNQNSSNHQLLKPQQNGKNVATINHTSTTKPSQLLLSNTTTTTTTNNKKANNNITNQSNGLSTNSHTKQAQNQLQQSSSSSSTTTQQQQQQQPQPIPPRLWGGKHALDSLPKPAIKRRPCDWVKVRLAPNTNPIANLGSIVTHAASSSRYQDRKWRNTFNVLKDTFF